MKTIRARLLAASLACLLTANASSTVLPDQGAEPVMQGSPPPADRVVNRINHIAAKNLRWSLTHMRMLLPTAVIRRGEAPVSHLRVGRPFSPPAFSDTDGTPVSFEDWMRRSHADALVILHRGLVVFEGYAPGVDPSSPHTLQSVSKSFVGVIAAMLANEGKIDPGAPVASYVPELAQSAWGTATMQQTLDMTVGVRYNEDIKDPKSDVQRYYGVASGTFPPPPGYDGPRDIYHMLTMLPQEGEHGVGFVYKTVNPEAVSWALARVTGKRPSELISERIWTKLGARSEEHT
ncbi:MAG: serine hydrolase domain-containing protein, partial [Gammaproteobacteria bacterium]